MKTYEETSCFLIVGRTVGGKTFRPSDWDVRLCGILSTFVNGRLQYSRHVRPVRHGSDKAVLVDGALKASDTKMWNFLLHFSEDNELVVEHPDSSPQP